MNESIERIGIRQDEIRSYICDVTTVINDIKLELGNLPKNAHEAKAKFHLAIQKNHELISRLYDTISNFESVRCRYQQEIGKTTKDKLYFIHVELQRIEASQEEDVSNVFKIIKEMRSLLSDVQNNPSITNQILETVNKQPEYDME